MYCRNAESRSSTLSSLSGGPARVQDPLQLPPVTTGRHCRGLGGGAAVFWQEDTLLPFSPLDGVWGQQLSELLIKSVNETYRRRVLMLTISLPSSATATPAPVKKPIKVQK